MILFPFFEDIEDKTFLVIGGGDVAFGKVKWLRQFTDKVCVIAPDTRIDGVQVIKRPFIPEDLAHGDYVIAATDDRSLNRQIAQRCRDQGRPVNVVDDPTLCTWLFPAVIRRGALTVGISTAGASPAYAQHLRRQIEEEIPAQIEDILDAMQALRRLLPMQIENQKHRRSLLRSAMDAMLAQPELVKMPTEQWLSYLSADCEREDQVLPQSQEDSKEEISI